MDQIKNNQINYEFANLEIISMKSPSAVNLLFPYLKNENENIKY